MKMAVPSTEVKASLYSCPGSPSLLILGGKGCHIGGAFGAQTRSSVFVVLVHKGDSTIVFAA